MRLTEVRQTLPSTVFIVAWFSTFVVSSYTRGLIAQTPGVLDSAQLAAIWKSVYYPIFDSVVVSAGLSRLRSSVLPEGRREVRIWVGGGFTAPEDRGGSSTTSFAHSRKGARSPSSLRATAQRGMASKSSAS
jgi:hypothetical protein